MESSPLVGTVGTLISSDFILDLICGSVYGLNSSSVVVDESLAFLDGLSELFPFCAFRFLMMGSSDAVVIVGV